jgi:transcriptional antiterminator NusG
MRRLVEKGVIECQPRAAFHQGDRIRILEAPFADFIGTVEDVYESKHQLRVRVMLFGRATPIEIDMAAVEKDQY